MSNIDDEIESNLDVILIKFAVRVLDVYQDKENPTFGDLIDTPAQTIKQLITDARLQELHRLAGELYTDGGVMGTDDVDDYIAERIKELKENN